MSNLRPALIRQDVVDVVLEQRRDPFTFELRAEFEKAYGEHPGEWAEMFPEEKAGL